jgi:hypothetical protein
VDANDEKKQQQKHKRTHIQTLCIATPRTLISMKCVWHLQVLTTLFGAVSPVLWGRCFAYFATSTPESALGFLGPYGHMVVVAVVRLAALLCVRCIPASELHLEDDNRG